MGIEDTKIKSSAQASELAHKRWAKHRERQEAARQKVEGRPLRILQGLGFATVEAAPEHLQIMAELASGGDNLALSALKGLASLGKEAMVYREGVPCPLCGGASEVIRLDLSRETIDAICESARRDENRIVAQKYQIAEPLEASK